MGEPRRYKQFLEEFKKKAVERSGAAPPPHPSVETHPQWNAPALIVGVSAAGNIASYISSLGSVSCFCVFVRRLLIHLDLAYLGLLLRDDRLTMSTQSAIRDRPTVVLGNFIHSSRPN